MANESVYKYLHDTNRPYSANDIHLNLHKEFGKTAVQKALDALVAEARIIEKIYGKQKVYCAKQDAEEKGEGEKNDEDEAKDIESNIASLADTLCDQQAILKSLENELKAMHSVVPTEELLKEAKEIAVKIETIKVKLDNLPVDAQPVSPGKFEKLKKEHITIVKAYRSRKRICQDMMNAVLEGYPNSKKSFIEEVGIETDESVGFVSPP